MNAHDIAHMIEIRVVEIQEQVKSLEAARATLTSTSRAESDPEATRRPSSQRPTLAPALEAILTDEPDGLNATALAAQIGQRPAVVRAQLAQLETSKLIHRRGHGRDQRWHYGPAVPE